MGAYEGPTNFLNVGASPSLMLNFAREKSLRDQISGKDLVTFTRSSTGTYVGSDGLIKTASADEPRFDHDPATGESLGLLIEETKGNRINGGFGTSIRTTDYLGNTSGTGWTMTANAGISPDGTNTATLLSQSQGLINSAIPWITGVMDSGRTFSVFVKHISGSVNLHGQFGSGDLFQVNLETGVNNASPTSRIRDIQLVDYANGWKRLSIYAVDIGPTLGELVGTAIYLSMNSAASDILLWGWQVEDGTFPTSYIPTSAGTVTRSADTAQITGTNFTGFYNQSEGSFYLESTLSPAIAAKKYFTLYNNNDASEIVEIATQEVGKVNVFTYDSSTTQSDVRVSSSTDRFKSAAAYALNSVNIAVNGTLGTLDTSASQPSGIDRMYIGTYVSGSYYCNCPIKQLIYYPARISDIKLQQMTKVFS